MVPNANNFNEIFIYFRKQFLSHLTQFCLIRNTKHRSLLHSYIIIDISFSTKTMSLENKKIEFATINIIESNTGQSFF